MVRRLAMSPSSGECEMTLHSISHAYIPLQGAWLSWKWAYQGWWAESRHCLIWLWFSLDVFQVRLNKGCQVLLSKNPLFLLKLLENSYISITSVTRQSIYSFALASLHVVLNLTLCPVPIMCFAMANFFGFPRCRCLVFFAPDLNIPASLSNIHFLTFTR